MSKNFLDEARGKLHPNSDAATVGRTILTAHDAAELALAAISDHLGVMRKGNVYLMEYPDKIQTHLGSKGQFPGVAFLKRLNSARVQFKHQGIVPDPRTWYRVIDETREWIDKWCRRCLDGIGLDEIDLERLLEDPSIQDLYHEAKSLFEARQYKEALEKLGLASYELLVLFPGIDVPVFGRRITDHALMLSAFGIRPSDYLTLQSFLPNVTKLDGQLVTQWERKGTGHEGNWTQQNVAFCLETFLDLALKVQHAPWPPSAVSFSLLFIETIRARSDGVELWAYDPQISFSPNKRRVVLQLKKGQMLRCHRISTEPGLLGLAGLAGPDPYLEILKAAVGSEPTLALYSDEIPGGFALVKRDEVELSDEPKDIDFVRKYYSHILRKQ